MNKEYTKGVNFERKLVEKFSENGFIAMRIAGSGRYSELLPDLIVMKSGIIVAIQCKLNNRNDKIYLSKCFENFKKFKEITNIKCFFAVKFMRKDVRFYDLENINKNIDVNDSYTDYDDFIGEIIKNHKNGNNNTDSSQRTKTSDGVVL